MILAALIRKKNLPDLFRGSHVTIGYWVKSTGPLGSYGMTYLHVYVRLRVRFMRSVQLMPSWF
jgi:hypothetical protein